MKTALRLIASFFIGGFIGFGIITLCLWMFEIQSPAETAANLMGLELHEVVIVPLLSLLLAIAAGLIHVVLHETGHLIGGLATGYRFVSFRIFSFALLRNRTTGKLRCKRYNIAGTAGQCLLLPPIRSYEEMPLILYHLGGVAMNFIVMGIGLVWFAAIDNDTPFQLIFSLFLFVIGLFMIIINGIPMTVNGVPNDGMVYRLASLYDIDCQSVSTQLRVNAALQRGMTADILPKEWFENPEVNYSDPLQFMLEMMRIGIIINEFRYTEAHAELHEINKHRDKVKGLLQMELDCEYAFTALITGDDKLADKLLTKKLMQYIDSCAKTMSPKARLQIAITYYRDGNHAKARMMLDELIARRDRFLLPGEADTDIEICRDIIVNRH